MQEPVEATGQREQAAPRPAPREAALFLDQAARIRDANGEACRLFRCREEDLVGKPLDAVLEPAAPSGDVLLAAPMIGRRPDGSRFPALVAVVPEPDGLRVSVRDHAGRQASLEEVMRREEQLREAQHVAKVGSWHWDVREDRVEWSDELYDIFGLDRQGFDPSYQAFLDRVHPDDREEVDHEIQQAMQGRRSFRVEHRIMRPDGQERYVHAEGAVAVDADGEPIRLYGIAQDVTAFHRADQDRDLFAQVFESAAEAIITLDTSGRVRRWNKAAETMYGMGPEVDGQGLAAFGDASRWGAYFERALAGEVLRSKQLQRQRRNGGLVTVSASLAPIRDRNGNVVGVSEVSQDITDQRRAQESDRIAFERLLEIKHLEEMAQVKGDLLNMVAHEINTPITPVKLKMFQLRQGHFGELNDDQRAAVELIQRNVDRLSRLTADVLEMARLDSGKMRMRRTRFAVAELFAEVKDAFAEACARAGVRLEAEAPDDIRVDGDRERILQVIYNLVSNAIKFTPPGGLVKVEAASDGDEVVLAVTDNGSGMTADQIERLFRPFAQVHDPSIRKGGTGLGLYISRSIVAQHDGTITCRSDGPDKGCVFEVRLPFSA